MMSLSDITPRKLYFNENGLPLLASRPSPFLDVVAHSSNTDHKIT